MNISQPTLHQLFAAMGAAGERISSIEASEGAAGNISLCVNWELYPEAEFTQRETYTLPEVVPHLAGRTLIVTGSGRRLRDVKRDPHGNLAVVKVHQDGVTATLLSSPARLFERITSEFNSHLAVHNDQIGRSGTNFHAVVHAQPLHLTYLSHLKSHQDTLVLNHKLMRWQPETIVNLPEGIGVLPFMLPGSSILMQHTVKALQQHRIVLWSKHGVMARSDQSVTKVVDRIEYAETAARYEYLDLSSGGQGEGLTPQELREIIAVFQVPTTLY
ncbi:rhamnulose-1-phosphate aldolase [Deinococcus roseus]|uniref:Rhamnulose-1-phosphate aldolase n=1 Tax=Deinococcus roseus TaxID=392414 RepID=A0ABQ2DIG8_9DEIO|nr:rhamnulose-1-phosphate aldolase [Deinococcus roseus]GGJ55933.1 rhamnulose-1-phosphate aldolase [Deinococcus roseus]